MPLRRLADDSHILRGAMEQYWNQLLNSHHIACTEQSSQNHLNIRRTKRMRYYLGDASGLYLTLREYECLQLMAQGLTMKKTAEILGLSARTVEFYLQNIKDKMGLRSTKLVLSRLSETTLDLKGHLL